MMLLSFATIAVVSLCGEMILVIIVVAGVVVVFNKSNEKTKQKPTITNYNM